MRVSYLNNLPIPLIVEWRSGFKFTLPSRPNFASNRLIVRVEIDFAHSVKVDVNRLLSVVEETTTPELKAMRDAFRSDIRSTTFGGMVLTLDYALRLEDLESYGGSVYYHELDCLVSMLPYDQAPPHPYGVRGSNLRLIEASPAGKQCGFGYSVDVVDNTGRYGDRYINIGGKIYRIDAVKDPTRRDGIYVVSNAPVQGELGLTGPVVKHYPFEGADTQLGLFRTAEEAEQLGDASLARKRELADLEHELNRNKTELQSAKHQHDLEMIRKNQELEEVKRSHERDASELERLRGKEELERQRIKDYYEDRSYQRKDNNEVLKFIPSIMVGIGALLMAVKGIFF